VAAAPALRPFYGEALTLLCSEHALYSRRGRFSGLNERRLSIMPDILVTKGTAALEKVSLQIKNLGSLTARIHAAQPSGNVTSCNLTANVLGDIISSNPLQVPPAFGAKTLTQRVAVIANLLNSPKMIYVNIVPDHHFIVFPIDTDKVVVLQGFQDVYNLIDWMENRGKGVMRKDEFVRALEDLVSGVEGRKRAAAVKLFSYSLANEGRATVSSDAQQVEQEIHKYYDGKVINIPVSAYKDL
jgi:hypothetical protein